MLFRQGDRVIYPSHGVAAVEAVLSYQIGSETSSCYRLRILANHALVIVPVRNASSVGLRPTVQKREVRRVFERLRGRKLQSTATNWRGRFKENSDRLRSGQLIEVAEVLRTLSSLSGTRSLSFREKRMLDQARELVVTELAAAEDATAEKISAKVEEALARP